MVVTDNQTRVGTSRENGGEREVRSSCQDVFDGDVLQRPCDCRSILTTLLAHLDPDLLCELRDDT